MFNVKSTGVKSARLLCVYDMRKRELICCILVTGTFMTLGMFVCIIEAYGVRDWEALVRDDTIESALI